MDAVSWRDNLDFDNCQFACPHLDGQALSLLVVSCNSAQDEAVKWLHEDNRLREELATRDQRLKELSSENEQLRRELKAIHRRPLHVRTRVNSRGRDIPNLLRLDCDCSRPALRLTAPIPSETKEKCETSR